MVWQCEVKNKAWTVASRRGWATPFGASHMVRDARSEDRSPGYGIPTCTRRSRTARRPLKRTTYR